jgi:hypothetical protein
MSIKDLDYDPLPENISLTTKQLIKDLLNKNPKVRPDAKKLLSKKEV